MSGWTKSWKKWRLWCAGPKRSLTGRRCWFEPFRWAGRRWNGACLRNARERSGLKWSTCRKCISTFRWTISWNRTTRKWIKVLGEVHENFKTLLSFDNLNGRMHNLIKTITMFILFRLVKNYSITRSWTGGFIRNRKLEPTQNSNIENRLHKQ